MGKPTEKKRKKKGRPSLLDLQKRSLRLQQQLLQQTLKTNPKPTPNPYIRLPNNSTGGRVTRWNPNPEPEVEQEHEEDDEEEGSGSSRKRREKKLKLVLRIPDHSENSPRHLGSSASELECEGSGQQRKIEAVGSDDDPLKPGRRSSLKATELLQESSGPMTALPDKKLLLFILDRLQRKDTYGVFSEPVDPEELPDYHEVIQHPMDFGTIRKKLSQGAYRNLEQFEKDVSLISSNAMRYNAPDSIYFRQARSIKELARKNFENLRQDDSDNEPETKTIIRRGRPPRPPAQLPASDFSEPSLPISGGGSNHCHALLLRSTATEKPGLVDASAIASFALHGSSCWIDMNKGDASSAKGFPTKVGKKIQVADDDRRRTYKQLQQYSYGCELPYFSLSDGKKKQLAAVGFHVEYAYARSLARFAADLGPIGWLIAAKKIEKILPPGTKYGRGWVGDDETHQHHIPSSSSSPSNQSSRPSNVSPEGNVRSTSLDSAPCCGDTKVGDDPSEMNICRKGDRRFPAPRSPGLPPTVNGFAPGTATRPTRLPMFIQTHSIHNSEKMKLVGSYDNGSISSNESQEQLAKFEPLQTDLNVGFQSSSSPASASASRVDSLLPDLALQL